MNPLVLVLAAAAALAASALLTGTVRRYALARSVLDVPNERSSHDRPTPRGGGLAIAVVALGGIAAAWGAGLLEGRVAAAAVGGGALVAGVGWRDDHGGLPARVRALAHFVAAAWALACLGGLPSLTVGAGRIPLGPAGFVLGALGIVWCVNLYNFMDGIDGIAAAEAVVAAGIGGALLFLSGHAGLAAFAVAVAAASGGFLLWNWAPARIFMGDVGSGLLGFLFAVLAVASERAGAIPLLGWALLLGVFLFDATVTLARRLLRRERLHEAHRRHAYQRAVQAGLPHARVTSLVAAVSAVLGGVAAACWARPALLVPGVAAGAVLLTWLYLRVERLLPMEAAR